MIQSVTNPRVKAWHALLDKKHREKENRFLVEGIHLVQEAILSGADVETIVYSQEQDIETLLSSNAIDRLELVAVNEQVMAKCTDTMTPQGVFAVIRKYASSAEHILASRRSLVVVVDGVQDPGNLGTIIRSADAAGADAVLLGHGTVDLYNPKTIRSTMGSLFHLPIASCDLAHILPLAREQSVNVVATTLEQSQSCYDTDFTQDSWIIVGNEGNGVSASAMRYASTRVKIPMPGRAESLNVAMATTILLFEAMRQRLR